jgi:hypothetical protein
MTIMLSDTTIRNVLIDARVEQLRGGRPPRDGGRIPRRN